MLKKWILVLNSLLLGIIIGVVFTANLGVHKKGVAEVPIIKDTTQSLRRPFARAIKRVLPAVVNISAEHIIKVPKGTPFEFQGPFEEFFREFFKGFPFAPEIQKTKSLGSGVIFKRDGNYYYILTNNHVIRNADKIIVKLSDESVYKGKDVKIVGTDPRTDIAVLKIKSEKELPVAPLGNSDSLQIGDWAIAIGNPFGLERTVTVGVISAKGRSGLALPQGPSYQDFIQTDAAINPGNSGGPLVNIEGEVIGINTAITTPSGGFVGVGFAIPINLAKYIADQLIKKGKVVRGYLGIRPQPMTPELAKAYGLEEPQGVLVAEVLKGTPAEKAGLKEGDVIIEFNGKKVTDLEKFRIMVAETPPGTRVKIKVLHPNGKEETLEVKLAEFPETFAQAPAGGEEETVPTGHVKWLGMEVVDVRSQEAKSFGIKETKGVVVISVDPESNASDAGIKPGDVIAKVKDIEINGLEDFEKAKEKYSKEKKPIVFKIIRGGHPFFVAIMPEE